MLPDGWHCARLGDLGEWASGGTPSRGRSDYYGDGIPWVKTGDLCDGPIDEIPESITPLGLANSSAKRLPKGTLLVAMYGATIGKLGVLPIEAATNQACAALLPTGKTADFIPYVFQFPLSQREELRRIGQGGAQPNISQSILKEYRIALPPLNEQRRIVAKLEALQSRSRRAREALDAVPPLLEKLRQSILAAAFRGDLTADWRAQNPNPEPASALLARIRTERRKKWEEGELAKFKVKGKAPTDDKWKAKYKEPEPIDTRALAVLPDGWCWAPVRDAFIWASGDFLPRSAQQEGKFPVYGGNGVSGYHAEALVASRTLVVGRVGADCGNVHMTSGPAWVTDNAIFAGVVPSAVNLAFWLLAIDRCELRNHARGGGQPFVSQETLNGLIVPLPPAQEQEALVLQLTTMEARLAKISAHAGEQQYAITTLEQALLTKAFRGELVPQDPSDEPADVTLSRAAAAAAAPRPNNARRRKAREARGARQEEA